MIGFSNKCKVIWDTKKERKKERKKMIKSKKHGIFSQLLTYIRCLTKSVMFLSIFSGHVMTFYWLSPRIWLLHQVMSSGSQVGTKTAVVRFTAGTDCAPGASVEST